ncbi:MAG: DUF2628 domain-containing protein [Planctomycetota bacterium]|nr:DUF2628 domain-containing protein [Planctomycetota bacterium]
MQFFIRRSDKIKGPFDRTTINNLVSEGKVIGADEISYSATGPFVELQNSIGPLSDVSNPNPLGTDIGQPPAGQFAPQPTPQAPQQQQFAPQQQQFAPQQQQQFAPQQQQQFAPQQQQQFAQQQPYPAQANQIATDEQLYAAVQGMNTQHKEYYYEQFRKIRDKGESFETSWNWYAFFFGAIWYLVSGLYAKAGIAIAACVVLAGVPAPLFWIYFGLCGNYDLYLKKVKNKELW